jgi:hypothetical protein
VTIELEFNDGVVKEYLVAPIQATLILIVSDNAPTVTLSYLSSLTNLSAADTRQWMQYWVSKGVVKERLSGSIAVVGDNGDCSEGGEEGEMVYEIIENQAEWERLHQERGDIEVSDSSLL